ncbi:hypothetical protein I3842_07G073600 [Carya illinoinensis]|uniref:SET domain-containing protein n=1 Tax=Carya illinoinensis TaxID=32201 RepID=A0A922JGC0_CARIL|nr:hypothetical protein I3842_07G073600 [Carya illinoinensis]
MVTPFSISSSSPFLSPTKSLRSSSSVKVTKAPPLHFLHSKRLLSVSVTSSVQKSDTDSPPLPPKVETFWQWLRDEGVVSAKAPARPAVVPEGLGLVAQRDLSRNEVVLEVPKRFWINPDAVAASEIGTLCSELKPWVSVALFLIREKLKNDSPLRYYVDILPEYTHSTIYWSEEELAELQGTQLLSTTLSVKEYVRNEFRKVEEEIISPHKKLFPCPITLDEFFWAFGILRSRAFSHMRGQNLVLIPLADLINHSPSITTEDHVWEIKGAAAFFSRDSLFSLRTPVSVKAGEQVMIQYDINKSNADLALDYGFIEPKDDCN